MRVLLDECVPRALRRELPGHEVRTVAEAGWAGVRNGELLQLAAKQFDLLLTVDRNLEYQQNFAGLALAALHPTLPRLRGRVGWGAQRVAVLRPLMLAVLAAIPATKPRVVTHIHG